MELEALKTKALGLMKTGGFEVKTKITLEVDPKLPFMGYTTERKGKTVIVIAGWSLKSDMSLGLIIHELSHVYRIETRHPSHNDTFNTRVLVDVLKGKSIYPYQKEILFNILNTIKDLYADDISFDVYIKKSQNSNLNEFFLGWVHKPIAPVLNEKDKWQNAENVINAAFAKSNLARHNVVDTGGKLTLAVRDFLSKVDVDQSEKFEYFYKLMRDLPEEVTDKEFKVLLTGYLNKFLDGL